MNDQAQAGSGNPFDKTVTEIQQALDLLGFAHYLPIEVAPVLKDKTWQARVGPRLVGTGVSPYSAVRELRHTLITEVRRASEHADRLLKWLGTVRGE